MAKKQASIKKKPTKKAPAKKSIEKKPASKKAPAKESTIKISLEKLSEEELKKFTIAELKEICKAKGYKVPSKSNKEDIIKLILEGPPKKAPPKKASAKSKPKVKESAAKKKETGSIKQGTIASFMRKRTQLVGFEYGYNKHTQYSAEFLDNALDAIESFQWKQIRKDGPYKFTLDRELDLANLDKAFLQKEDLPESEKARQLNDQAKSSLLASIEFEPIGTPTTPVTPEALEASETSIAEETSETSEIQEKGEIIAEEEIQDEVIEKDQVEVEQEVRTIIDDLEEIINPVEDYIDDEPVVIIRIKEYEPPSFLTAELTQKNVMMYSFEIFDNGTGMNASDLRKYGRYLASSKSMELKQTRGSQGFGAPSAFSDAQNTTGKPVIAISKSSEDIYAVVSEFFTTSKNEKKYVVAPTEIDTSFMHGTYVKLNYLNVKYVRGYVDNYIKETALMNPHITIIFLDPYNEQFIFPRKVSSFPLEPKYAKPHPSSTNIGDLQDLLTKSENLTLSAFLQDNFVRISSKTAKEIIKLAERDLQDKLNVLILKEGYLTVADKKEDEIFFLRFEKRVYGKSAKPRDKLIIYKIEKPELLTTYWEHISKYNQFIKKREKVSKEIKKVNDRIEKSETKKEINALEKDIKNFEKEIETIIKEKDKIRHELERIIKNSMEGLTEQKKFKDREDLEKLVSEVEISKTRPINLTSDQFNSLFLAFKSVKYMAPPTDTAIPVGDSVLENTIIKELGLQVSENLDDFDIPVEELQKISNQLIEKKKNDLLEEDKSVSKDILNSINVDMNEVLDISSQILSSADIKNDISENGGLRQEVETLIAYEEIESVDVYSEVFDFFLNTFSRDDDFVAAETRNPTSGKGLAYVVEAVLAYSNKLPEPKRAYDVLSRFVNRTPKLRDSADCAITKAVQSVNWKNYKLNTYDNGMPKGPIKLLVNVSGPYVHLMFKSQSKNSLAGDEDLNKEIKSCLEAIGRQIRIYLNRQQKMRSTAKRTSKIEKYIPLFVKSIYNIAFKGESVHKSRLDLNELEELMKNAIGKKTTPGVRPTEATEAEEIPVKREEVKREVVKEEEIKKEAVKEEEVKREVVKEEPVSKPPEVKPINKEIKAKRIDYSEGTLNNYTKDKLIDICKERNIRILSKDSKTAIISKILDFQRTPTEVKPVKPQLEEPVKPAPVEPGTLALKREQLREAKGEIKSEAPPKAAPPKATTQTQLPIMTTDKIVTALSNEWQDIRELITKLKIKDMMDARFLQIKLKDLERKGQVIVDIKMGKKHWRLK